MKPKKTAAPASPAPAARPAGGADGTTSERVGPASASSRIVGLEHDPAETRDGLQSFRENQEAANEELQSLNEELETSKEELESTNEELTTVNEEMASRNSELHRLNGDLVNLQTSTKLVIVLLGRDRTIRRFSAEAGRQFGLLAGDAGRPWDGIRHDFLLPDLAVMIDRAIAAGEESQAEVRDKAGRWYSLSVRPYLTVEQAVDGAVLVLGDIDALKRTEQLITEARDHAEAISRTVPNPMLVLTAGLRIQSANEAFHRAFRTSAAEIEGRSIFEIDRRSWNLPRLRRLLETVVPEDRFFDDFAVTHTFERIGRRSLLLNARLVIAADGKPKEILLGIRDITERKRAEEALAAARRQLAGHAGKLEKLVARRTAELTASNRRLEAAAAAAARSREEYRTLFLAAQVTQEKLRTLSRQVLTAQEDERRRISRELHDGVVQLLVGINVELAALNRAADLGPRPLRAKIARTQRLVEKAVAAVHRFARELRPAALDDLGLIPALQTYLRSMAAQKKLKINLTAFAGVEQLDSARRTVLYRVVQEAVTNVSRHARASAVDVTISRLAGAVRLEVSDNGKAFDVGRTLAAKTNTRLGLVGLRERVEMVGGTVTLVSAPGRGTRVCAELPLRRRGGAA